MECNPLIVVGTPRDGKGGGDVVLKNWQRAVATGIGSVIIDGDPDTTTTEAAAKAGAYVYVGGDAEETVSSNYVTESGAERVAATVNRFDRFYNHDIVINIYAKLPPIASEVIKALMYPLANPDVDVATLVIPVTEKEASSQDMVKVELELAERRHINILTGSTVGRVTSFTRHLSEAGDGPYYKHVPIYAYKRASLDRFLRFEPTVREMEERLEPERALANGMRVDAVMLEHSD